MPAWELPVYSRTRVAKAGREVAKHLQAGLGETTIDVKRALVDDIAVINNFRASHAFPLNTFQTALRAKSREIDPNAIVAQRLKRMPTIIDKLRRFPDMNLSRMQDIGGCRAVMASIESVYDLSKAFENRKVSHILANKKDYIKEPKASGYRGIHLIYKYVSDRNDTYNNYHIEVQVRSQLQHAWATAVETAGMLLKQQLKSSQGEERWLEFFAYASSAISFLEGTPHLHTQCDRVQVANALREVAASLHAFELLRAVSTTMQLRENQPDMVSAGYFILVVNTESQELSVYTFKKNEAKRASSAYETVEHDNRNNENIETVLVSVESFTSLKSAYPNYYGDASVFIETIEEFISA
ncbi:RelA/SpoT domain-containing protein [Salinicola salarius]|uniref:RelA/SpoT domain-containing protein n=1 Tax=Salinicola salarius TaxID=430457 RepID=UPI0023E4588D|nr:RelA/SpoT domain-containing protein [Salinicola salarius]MDF3917482.1 RelA/SpoT domain-containing protein [Salinicola salarius]